MPEHYSYIVFPSTHEAIRAEKILLSQGTVFTIVPTPRSITTSCGICIRFDPAEEKIFRDFLDEYEVQIDGIYLLPQKY